MARPISNCSSPIPYPSTISSCPDFIHRVKNLYALAGAPFQKKGLRPILFIAFPITLAAMALMLIPAIALAAIGGIYHRYHTSLASEQARAEFERTIDTAFRDELTKALPGPVEGRENDPAIKPFVDEVILFSKEVEQKALSQQQARERLVHFKNSPIYMMLLPQRNHPAIQFLHRCFLHLNQTDAQGALLKYGEALFGDRLPQKKSYGMMDLVRLLKPGFGKIYTRDGRFDTLMWSMNHVERAKLNLIHGEDPQLNCHRHNPTYLSMPLTVKGQKLDYQLGPGPTGTGSVHKNGLIEAYKTFGIAECRFSHQSTHKRGEYERVKEAHSWQRGHEESFGHASLSFDRKSKTHQNLRELLPYGQDEGMTIPKHLLSDAQLEKTLRIAEEIVATCKNGNEVPQFITDRIQDAVIARAILAANPRFDRVSSPCKQHFDRGTANTIIAYSLDRLINRQPFTREDLLKIAGGARVRPHVTEDRAPQKRRIDQALAVLEFLSSSEEKVRELLLRVEQI